MSKSAVTERRVRQFFERASPATKQVMGRIAKAFAPPPAEAKRWAAIGRALQEEYESWEKALRGDTSKLEARIKARIATDAELELICDLAAGRVKGKKYLKHLMGETTREVVAGYFLEIQRDNPRATLTKVILDDTKKRFRIGRSLAAEIWGNVKRKIAESTQL